MKVNGSPAPGWPGPKPDSGPSTFQEYSLLDARAHGIVDT